MGRIHVLSEAVANKIAAGEVVERPASVVKELLENSLDAGAARIKINVEAGGKRLIQVVDNGCGMVRDDAMLAFERHATSKIKDAEDLLSVATLGFRGEALPSIASVSRLRLETCAAKNGPDDDVAGTVIEINGGKIARVEDAGLPAGTSITVRDLFFNTPARKRFLKAESTELSHIASLVTHYALAHPDKHFELHSATNAILVAPPVADSGQRVYQVFGKEVLDQLIPVAALQPLERIGLPQSPPWRREEQKGDAGTLSLSTSPIREDLVQEEEKSFGELRAHGFVSKPEIQKLNRNSIYVFVNGRLIRDRLIQHALTEAYRTASPSLTPGARATMVDIAAWRSLYAPAAPAGFALQPPVLPPATERLHFGNETITVEANAAVALARIPAQAVPGDGCTPPLPIEPEPLSDLVPSLASLKPLGQVRESFILAVNHEGLWIIDQHVAHERVLFERVLK